MDSNGYNPSLLDTEEGTCYRCKRKVLDTVRHECFFGVGNRKLSKAYGLWVNLCPQCHSVIHNSKEADEYLKRDAYKTFIKKYSREYFYDLFKRYYDE